MGGVFTALWSFGNIPPFLCWFDYPGSPEEIQGHLPEWGVYGISDHPRKPGPKGIVVEMGDSPILFNDVPDFGDGFVPIYFMLRQFRSPCALGHDAVGDFVQMEEVSVVFSKIPFIGVHFLDGLIGMTTAGDAKRKKWAVMEGCGSNLRGKNKPIPGIDGGVFLEPEMGFVIRIGRSWRRLTIQTGWQGRLNFGIKE